MEDQILYADSTEEVASDENPYKKLLKKEQRLLDRLQEEQEAEAEAQDRFQRAKARLSRRKKRVERIQRKLSLVQGKLAELQITDQHMVYKEHEVILVPLTKETSQIASEEKSLIQPEQDYVTDQVEITGEPETGTIAEEMSNEEPVVQQEETTTPVSLTPLTFESTPEADTPASYEEADISSTSSSEDENTQELEVNAPTSIEATIVNEHEQEPSMTSDSNYVEDEALASESVDISSEKNTDRRPTKPLQLEQPVPTAAVSHDSSVQSAKEAWIAAESALQHARYTASGIKASISYVSQSDGLSNEFLEELVRKQADANRELLKAQDTARAAYERFVQAQRDTESAASLPVAASMNTSEDHLQQKQENASLPPAEDNGADQTAKFHAVHLYKEW